MMQSSKNNGYTAADIEKYHSGKMPAAQMHALEKAAMEDPFLADALEGYAFATTPLADIEKLKSRLAENKEDRKIVPLLYKDYNWLKAAAIIFVLAGSSWFFLRTTSSGKNEIAQTTATENKLQKAEVKDEVNANTITTPASDSVSISKNNTELSDIKKIPSTTFSTVKPTELKATETIVDGSTSNGNAVVQDDVAFKSKSVYKPSVVEHKTVQPIAPGVNNNPNYSTQNRDVTLKRSIPELNNSNNARAKTEADKLFFKENKDSMTDKDVAVLQGKSQNVNRSDTITNLNIVLQQSNEGLSEVVVISPGKRQMAKQKMPEITIDTLEPTVGWAQFDEYIATNIQRPEELKIKQPVSGEVELSFDINKNGEPVNIAVVKSLCNKCDEEAIRLLKAGPKWKKKKNKNAKVTINF
jgi:hypothetical protein